MTDYRCASNRGLPWLALMACCYCCLLLLPAPAEGGPQFSNLRIFRRAGGIMTGMFSQHDGGWHPLAWFAGNGGHKALEEATSRSSQSSNSPIKRVSMAVLLQQLAQASAAFGKDIPGSNNEILPDLQIDPSESNETTTMAPVKPDSPIRRVWLPAGSVVYSRNDNASPSVIINVNPHLRKTSTTTTTTEPPTTTTTTTTTTPSPTTTISARSAYNVRPFKPTIISKIKSSALKTNSTGRKKTQSKRPNSPIYYIKLPSSSFVPAGVKEPSSSVKPPIFIVTTTPSTTTTSTEVSTTTSAKEEEEDPVPTSTTTLRPARTNSRIINIKGPFVFNGKPGGIYSASSPYRAPNYLEILNDLYPKLKRAQFIRR